MTKSGLWRRWHRPTTAFTAAAGLAVSGTIFTGGAAFGALYRGDVEVVTGADTNSWVPIAFDCFDNTDLKPHQRAVFGPQRTPYGSGSHQMRIGTFAEQTEIYRTPRYDGTPLADITRLAYSTYAKQSDGAGPDRQLPYLRLTLDSNANGVRDGSDDSLFFYPSNNQGTTANPHGIVNGRWQHWNVADGLLNVNGDDGPGNATTLPEYAQTHPGATLINNNGGAATGGSIATIVGCGSFGNDDTFRNGTYNVDRVIVGDNGQDTLFDFETSVNDETSTKSSLVTVNADHLRGWVHSAFDAETNADLVSNQRFVNGPADPPAGVGSLRFRMNDNVNRVEQFRTPRYDRRLLRDLRGLSYWTYVRPDAGSTTASSQQPPYLRINISTDGNRSMEEQLYFIPANNGAIQQDAWQKWNAYKGVWNINGDDGPANTTSLESYLVEHPDARIVNNAGGIPAGGGVDFQVGASGDNQRNSRSYLDNINIRFVDKATSTMVTGKRYDLEP